MDLVLRELTVTMGTEFSHKFQTRKEAVAVFTKLSDLLYELDVDFNEDHDKELA